MFAGVEFCDYPNPDNVTKLDHCCLPMISDMHKYGIRLDVPLLQGMSKDLGQQLEDIEYESSTILGAYQDVSGKGVRKPFMITSPDHVSRLLFVHLKVQGDDEVPMTEKGARYATSDDILGLFKKRHPIISLILEHRTISKVKGTYADALPLLVDSDSRLHTTFNAVQAATGRLASSNPNLQNIPIRTEIGKLIRAAFVPRPGYVLVSSDLSQIEMVWAAHRSQDPTMLEVFRLGQDLHSRTACIVFNLDYGYITRLTAKVDGKTASPEEQKEYKFFKSFQRLPCKTTGFGVLYGQTEQGLRDSLMADGVDMSLELCKDFIDNKFFGAYPRLKDMLDRDYSRAKAFGMIWDEFGRVRLVPQAKSSLKWLVSEGCRQAGNHPEQSSAQATVKLSMGELTPIYRKMGDVFPTLQIHDQLIAEVKESRAEEWAQTQRYVMEHATPLSIPTRASSDIGNSWMEL
jgi:DNA polymerase I